MAKKYLDEESFDVAVGEDRVVAPDGKQLALLTFDGWFGQVADPAHDQARGDLLVFGLAGERGVGGDLGFGLGDQLAGVGIDDRSGIADLPPGIGGNAGDRGGDRGVHTRRQRGIRPAPAAGGDHISGVELRVRPHDPHPTAPGLVGGGQGVGDEPGCATHIGRFALAQPHRGDDRPRGRC
ncbi:hypothetical protein BJ970_004903 [Saccharopolyspora phatthalungensis]|uniref:Uncharacterized protein n=1 Tax=Saccharopolyspora phatthalungensis TaxID=664693 RepID=A0A840QFJ6_9PSEU|nr:hypothetical protein [Saccharopolyspora phatthalungensis]